MTLFTGPGSDGSVDITDLGDFVPAQSASAAVGDTALDFMTVETNFLGAPATSAMQVPPHTHGRPI